MTQLISSRGRERKREREREREYIFQEKTTYSGSRLMPMGDVAGRSRIGPLLKTLYIVTQKIRDRSDSSEGEEIRVRTLVHDP
jgi:hypothetical protein